MLYLDCINIKKLRHLLVSFFTNNQYHNYLKKGLSSNCRYISSIVIKTIRKIRALKCKN